MVRVYGFLLGLGLKSSRFFLGSYCGCMLMVRVWLAFRFMVRVWGFVVRVKGFAKRDSRG